MFKTKIKRKFFRKLSLTFLVFSFTIKQAQEKSDTCDDLQIKNIQKVRSTSSYPQAHGCKDVTGKSDWIK